MLHVVSHRTKKLNSHRGVNQMRVDRWDVESGEEVTVHVVDSSQVVDVCGVVEQVVRLIGQEITINHRRQNQVVHQGA